MGNFGRTQLVALIIAIHALCLVFAKSTKPPASLFEVPGGKHLDSTAPPETVLWGTKGHAMTAAVAMRLVTPSTAQCVQSMVGSLSAVATWPDSAKKTPAYHWSAALHYVNTLEWACDFQPSRDCPDGCVVSAIANYTSRLIDPQLSLTQRREALKFVAHFLGDIHQPLHLGFGVDRGGNNIKGTFFGQHTSLHGVWDDSVIDRRVAEDFPQEGSAGMVAHLVQTAQQDTSGTTVPPCNTGLEACPAEWARESVGLACTEGYRNRHGQVVKDGFEVLQPEYKRLLPLVEAQLIKGGVRLARLLDVALDNCPTSRVDAALASKAMLAEIEVPEASFAEWVADDEADDEGDEGEEEEEEMATGSREEDTAL